MSLARVPLAKLLIILPFVFSSAQSRYSHGTLCSSMKAYKTEREDNRAASGGSRCFGRFFFEENISSSGCQWGAALGWRRARAARGTAARSMGPDGRATHAADAIEARPAMGAARQNEFFGWVRGGRGDASRKPTNRGE